MSTIEKYRYDLTGQYGRYTYRVISDDVSNLSKGAQTNKTSSKKSLPSLSASGCKLVVNFLFCCNSVI